MQILFNFHSILLIQYVFEAVPILFLNIASLYSFRPLYIHCNNSVMLLHHFVFQTVIKLLSPFTPPVFSYIPFSLYCTYIPLLIKSQKPCAYRFFFFTQCLVPSRIMEIIGDAGKSRIFKENTGEPSIDLFFNRLISQRSLIPLTGTEDFEDEDRKTHQNSGSSSPVD